METSKLEFKKNYSEFRKKLRSINDIDQRVDFMIESEFRDIYIKPKPFKSLKISLYKDGVLNPKLKLVKGPIFF